MSRKPVEIKLSSLEINMLSNIVKNASDPVLSRRASVILACSQGMSNKAVSDMTGMNETDVGHWRNLVAVEGVDRLLGKNNGGSNQFSHSDDEFNRKLDELLSQDKEWTKTMLVQELNSTPSIVAGALRKRCINLQRQRQWVIETHNELISKNVDVVGLYITKEEQALIICCSQEPLGSRCGEFITRSRSIFEDFNSYNGEISLAKAINTAAYHVEDISKVTFVSLQDFLDRTIASFPEDDGFEYQLILCSSKTNYYRGNRLMNVYQTWADNPDEWLEFIHLTLDALGDHNQLNAVYELGNALQLYLENCTVSTNPIMWRKLLTASAVSHPLDTKVKEVPRIVNDGTVSTDFLDDIRKVILKHFTSEEGNDDSVRCGFISFAFDSNEVRLCLDDDGGSLIKPSEFGLSTPEKTRASMTSIEHTLMSIRNIAGAHAAEMTTDLLKKNVNLQG